MQPQKPAPPTVVATGARHPLSDEVAEQPTTDDIAQRQAAFQELQDEYLALQGDDSDWAASERSRIKSAIKRYGSHVMCGDEPMVEVVIPLSVQGFPFTINGVAYDGKKIVPACTARELARMVYENQRVENSYLRGATKQLPDFELNARTVR